jgi:hypothetical protein
MFNKNKWTATWTLITATNVGNIRVKVGLTKVGWRDKLSEFIIGH